MEEKELLERIEALEKKLEIQLGLINHLTKVMSDKIITKIEFDVNEAAKKIIAEGGEFTDENGVNDEERN